MWSSFVPATTTGRDGSLWKKSKSPPHSDQTFYSYYVLSRLAPGLITSGSYG